MTEYKMKVYTKKKELVNRFLKLKYELNDFKQTHNSMRSAFSYRTKYYYQDQLKELESELRQNKLSVQKINRSFVFIKKRKLSNDKLIDKIIENFCLNYQSMPKMMEYKKDLNNSFWERRTAERQKRNTAALQGNKKVQEARKMIPLIFNFIKEKIQSVRKDMSENEVNKAVERIMISDNVDYYLQWYKKEVQTPKDITRNKIELGLLKGYENIDKSVATAY